MAYEIPSQNITLEASGDLSTDQYKAVVVDSVGQLALAGAGAQAIGILQNKPDDAGSDGSVMTYGVTKGELGGTVTAGDSVASDASGTLVTSSVDEYIVGIALEGGAAGEVVPVALKTATSV